ncbi:MAG: hypothetical protein K6C34_02505 [Alphaproteobacteria bacterium]|nr:hypothetical protein [Alphaproteobacteria bacterium]
MQKISLVFLLVITACMSYQTPPLPDLNTKSFSYEKIMQQQKELQKKIELTKEELGKE